MPAFPGFLLSGDFLAGCTTQGKLGNGTPVGSYQITVTGYALNGTQMLTHSTAVTLNVKFLY